MSTPIDTRPFVRRFGFDPEYRDEFAKKLFFEGNDRGPKIKNFFVLLLLAAAIATFGVISDSTATVIGAMIVAPLMTPIMAMAAAVVLASPQRMANAFGLVAAGVISVIALSWLLAWLVPDVALSFYENSQITSRVSPGLVALLSALASGAAGAYIISRKEIADSMGGVAIAISLVPPLCVVGIAINKLEWSSAVGAFTLFVTNFLAILLAGGLTFVLDGVGRSSQTEEHVRMRRRAFTAIGIATVLIAIPLSITSWRVINDALETRAVNQLVGEWLAPTDYDVANVEVNGQQIKAVVEGAGDLPALQPLANTIGKKLGRRVVVDMRTIPSQVAESNDE